MRKSKLETAALQWQESGDHAQELWSKRYGDVRASVYLLESMSHFLFERDRFVNQKTLLAVGDAMKVVFADLHSSLQDCNQQHHSAVDSRAREAACWKGIIEPRKLGKAAR
jgi:hypothetical protein